MPNFSGRNWTERGFTIGIGGLVWPISRPQLPAAIHLPSQSAYSPVGSGKTALTLALCRHFRDSHNIGPYPSPPYFSPLARVPDKRSSGIAAVVTNDIFTREDQEFLIRHEALSDKGRIRAIETGASARSPHAS